jgi:flagellar basal-body rod protein FlgB
MLGTMDLGEIPLFAMLKGRMGYLSDRQRVISENVANADSPGYTPHDLKPFSFEARVKAATATPGVGSAAVGQAMTQPGHMQLHGGHGATPVKAQNAKDSETTLDGNSVVLEEEMMKMTDARMNYDAAISFYQKSLGMLKLAIRKPGQG